jgi:hypothetical protein
MYLIKSNLPKNSVRCLHLWEWSLNSTVTWEWVELLAVRSFPLLASCVLTAPPLQLPSSLEMTRSGQINSKEMTSLKLTLTKSITSSTYSNSATFPISCTHFGVTAPLSAVSGNTLTAPVLSYRVVAADSDKCFCLLNFEGEGKIFTNVNLELKKKKIPWPQS